jgi:twitching motility protein PilT
MLNMQELSPQENTDPNAAQQAAVPQETQEATEQVAPPQEATEQVAPPQEASEQPVSATPSEAPAQETAGQTASRITLDQLINLCIEKEASDIHFREGGRVALRVGGKMIFVENVDVLTKEEMESIVSSLVPNGDEREKLEHDREIDFSYTHANGVNFRVNLFFQKGMPTGVMRMIYKNVPSMQDLGVPENIKNVLGLREGLILVCGTAGSGKSTTIQSMIEHINENFIKHVLTIENPIEYVYEDKKSIITQRELGKDTLTMDKALNSAIRMDVNVVMVSEVNSYEELDDLLNLVETGHLVIASMQTRDASQTVERMVSYYPPDMRKRAQDRIANDLIAILAQDLAERQDQAGLIAIFELMFMNQSIRQVIKRGNFVQLRTAIQSAANEGMITMDSYAYELAQQGIITQDQASEYVQREEE